MTKREDLSQYSVKWSDYNDPEPHVRYSRLRPPGECAFCDEHRNDSMMPSHDPSPRCESGKHPHCTCDTCF